MQQKNKEEDCVGESHLGQEVSRLSSYAFQNERGFSVQIGVLGGGGGGGEKKESREGNKTEKSDCWCWCCIGQKTRGR